MELDSLSLTGDLTGARAAEQLLTPSTATGDDVRLMLATRNVDRIDVVAATATRMRIARHMREHRSGAVTLFLPRDTGVAGRYLELLRPLPEVVDIDGATASPPAHFALLPATVVDDSEAAWLIGERVWDACYEARISRRRAGYIAEAAVELTDNALIHASESPDAPVVAISSIGRERIVDVSVTDAGTEISEATDPAAMLRQLPGSGIEGVPGFLSRMMGKAAAAADVDVTLRVIAGTGRLLWTRTQHRTARGRYVPGMTVVARISARER